MILTLARLSHPICHWLYLPFFFLFLSSACTARSGVNTEAQELKPAQSSEQARHSKTRQSLPTGKFPHGASSAVTAFEQGQQALQAQRYELAASWFERAIQLDATQADYYLGLGRAYGRQAEQVDTGNQFFLARKVRKNLERAVELNPELIEARLDLLSYYLQAPGLLGGGVEKAKVQATEIARRDSDQGLLAWQQCQQAEATVAPLFTVAGK